MPYKILVDAISFMPDGTGVRAIAQMPDTSIFIKLAEELSELRNAINHKHADVSDVPSAICREVADIFNLCFGLCLKEDCLFPGVFRVDDGPRKWSNVTRAFERLRLNLDLQTMTNFLTQVVQYVKFDHWKFEIEDVIKMMAIKAMEKGVKYGYIETASV